MSRSTNSTQQSTVTRTLTGKVEKEMNIRGRYYLIEKLLHKHQLAKNGSSHVNNKRIVKTTYNIFQYCNNYKTKCSLDSVMETALHYLNMPVSKQIFYQCSVYSSHSCMMNGESIG
jgi:hypothetical protein